MTAGKAIALVALVFAVLALLGVGAPIPLLAIAVTLVAAAVVIG